MTSSTGRKDSGIEWAGAVPVDWEIRRLKDMVCILNGYPFESSDFSKDEGSQRVIRIRDLSSDDDPVFYSGPAVPPARVADGDVLIGMDGDFNVSWWSGGPALLNQRLCCLREIRDIDRRFLYYTLPLPLKVANDLTYFTTVKHLSSGQVASLRIPLPSLPLQCAIAAFLDRKTAAIDALIERKVRLIDLLQERRQALITQAVTKGVDPNVPMKESGIPSIPNVPSRWTVVRNKVLLREVNERVGPDACDDLLTVSHLTGVSRRSDRQNVTMFMAESTDGYKRCSPGDLAINTMWAWMGALGVASIGGIVSPSYNVYRFKAWQETRFFDLLFRTPPYVAEIGSRSEGVWTSRLRLYPEAFLGLLTAVPPPEEQVKILTFIDHSLERENRIESRLREALNLLREYRQALISAAVTGKIDIPSGEAA